MTDMAKSEEMAGITLREVGVKGDDPIALKLKDLPKLTTSQRQVFLGHDLSNLLTPRSVWMEALMPELVPNARIATSEAIARAIQGDASAAVALVDQFANIQIPETFSSQEIIEKLRNEADFSRVLVGVFAAGAAFLANPNSSTLARLNSHQVDLTELVNFHNYVRFENPPAQPIKISGSDAIILSNNFRNAHDHSALSGGREKLIKGTFFEDADEMVIGVSNISPDELTAKDWQPGETRKLDATTGKKKHGAGYGLHIARTIAETTGRRLDSESPRVDDSHGEPVYNVTVSLHIPKAT